MGTEAQPLAAMDADIVDLDGVDEGNDEFDLDNFTNEEAMDVTIKQQALLVSFETILQDVDRR
jgi:hypothetical protein